MIWMSTAVLWNPRTWFSGEYVTVRDRVEAVLEVSE